jgi:hypothetical protein
MWLTIVKILLRLWCLKVEPADILSQELLSSIERDSEGVSEFFSV